MSNGNIPLDVLEQRAAEQRKKIDNSVDDLKQLKSNLTDNVRETLNVKRHARDHFWTAVGVASLVALVVGHGIAGIFAD
jgi:ElaB/YqjD/DUF883 family membrane-anchored ribosome-binding protein